MPEKNDLLPAPGTRWGDVALKDRTRMPAGTVLGHPPGHQERGTMLRVRGGWLSAVEDYDFYEDGDVLRDRPILSYPPGTIYEAPSPTILPDQPPPTPGAGDVWQHMIETLAAEGLYADLVPAMRERRELGIARYGTPLQIHNSRDHRIDAMQELLDAAVYLWAAGDVSDARRCLFMASALLRRVGGHGDSGGPL